jgi:hypothetical protein
MAQTSLLTAARTSQWLPWFMKTNYVCLRARTLLLYRTSEFTAVPKKNALHQTSTSVPHKNTIRINSQVLFRIADKLQLYRYYIVSDEGMIDELERIWKEVVMA